MADTNRIFVNYPRDDTAAAADAIFLRFKESFGNVVFKDVDRMRSGQDVGEPSGCLDRGRHVRAVRVQPRRGMAQPGREEGYA